MCEKRFTAGNTGMWKGYFMKRKHFARVIVCITIMVWLLSGVNGEVNAVEQDTVVMSQKSSDKIQDGMHDCLDHKESGYVLYDFRHARNYGSSGLIDDTIDFEGFFGISVATFGHTVTCTLYTHTSSSSPVSLSVTRTQDRKPKETILDQNIAFETVAATLSKPGLYKITGKFTVNDSEQCVTGYVYADQTQAMACRVYTKDYNFIATSKSIWNSLFSNAKPEDYLSNEKIT